MLSKTLIWTTFGLLVTSALPFIATPAVASSASSGTFMFDDPTGGNNTALPLCGTCNIKPNQEYQKPYAIDRNTLCPPEKPYRVTVRMATKVICEGGSFWVCEDTSSMTCNVYMERPACPQDSCRRS